MNKKYYEVVAKCGHVGKKNYVPVAFAVVAESGKEAAKITRTFPRVKHDHKDAILYCNEISYNEFIELCNKNNNDLYLKCKSKQEQNCLDLSDRLKNDMHFDNNKYRFVPSKEDKRKRKERIKYLLKKFKISYEVFCYDNYI